MAKIDQLSFYDETKLGQSLIVLSMLAYFYYGNGPINSFFLNYLPTDHRPFFVWLDIILLLVITLIIYRYSLNRRDKHYRVKTGDEQDAGFTAHCTSITRSMTGKDIPLLTASTVGKNAFYSYQRLRPCVVAEKGLGIAFRKNENIDGIIAHECAHIKQKDIFFITLPLYLFYAFALLIILNISVIQIYFWSSWAMATFNQQSSTGSFITMIPRAFINIDDDIFIFIVTLLIIRHFIRTRELLVDELAAQHGYRTSLISQLTSKKERKRSLFAFHPTIDKRIQNLTTAEIWQRIDIGFMVAISYILARMFSWMSDDVASAVDQMMPHTEEDIYNINVDQMYNLISQMGFIIFIFFIASIMSFIFLNHINRISSTLIYNHASKSLFFKQILITLLSLSGGVLLAQLTDSEFLRTVYNKTYIHDWAALMKAISGPLVSFSLTLVAVTVMVLTGFLSAFIYVKRHYKSKKGRLVFLSILWTVMGMAIQWAYDAMFMAAGDNAFIRRVYFSFTAALDPHFHDSMKNEIMRAVPGAQLLFWALTLLVLCIIVLVSYRFQMRPISIKTHPAYDTQDKTPSTIENV